MTTCLETAVELLERAVAYTRGRLATTVGVPLAAPTPCLGWDLAALLSHMDDSLTAFIEGSREVVALAPVEPSMPPPADMRGVVGSLHAKACALLAAWVDPTVMDRAPSVRVGELALTRRWVAAAGALEIAVHGWDVGISTGHPAPIPSDLAVELLDHADQLVSAADRPSRFGVPVPQSDHASPSRQLLGLLGRDPSITD